MDAKTYGSALDLWDGRYRQMIDTFEKDRKLAFSPQLYKTMRLQMGNDVIDITTSYNVFEGFANLGDGKDVKCDDFNFIYGMLDAGMELLEDGRTHGYLLPNNLDAVERVRSGVRALSRILNPVYYTDGDGRVCNCKTNVDVNLLKRCHELGLYSPQKAKMDEERLWRIDTQQLKDELKNGPMRMQGEILYSMLLSRCSGESDKIGKLYEEGKKKREDSYETVLTEWLNGAKNTVSSEDRVTYRDLMRKGISECPAIVQRHERDIRSVQAILAEHCRHILPESTYKNISLDEENMGVSDQLEVLFASSKSNKVQTAANP